VRFPVDAYRLLGRLREVGAALAGEAFATAGEVFEGLHNPNHDFSDDGLIHSALSCRHRSRTALRLRPAMSCVSVAMDR